MPNTRLFQLWNSGSFVSAIPATEKTMTSAWMISDTLVGTPVAACIVVEPTRRTAKNSATTIVAIGCSWPISAMATPSKP